jgi:hypothetical protein
MDWIGKCGPFRAHLCRSVAESLTVVQAFANGHRFRLAALPGLLNARMISIGCSLAKCVAFSLPQE